MGGVLVGGSASFLGCSKVVLALHCLQDCAVPNDRAVAASPIARYTRRDVACVASGVFLDRSVNPLARIRSAG